MKTVVLDAVLPKEFKGLYRPRSLGDIIMLIIDLLRQAVENPSLVDGQVPKQLIRTVKSTMRRKPTTAVAGQAAGPRQRQGTGFIRAGSGIVVNTLRKDAGVFPVLQHAQMPLASELVRAPQTVKVHAAAFPCLYT